MGMEVELEIHASEVIQFVAAVNFAGAPPIAESAVMFDSCSSVLVMHPGWHT